MSDDTHVDYTNAFSQANSEPETIAELVELEVANVEEPVVLETEPADIAVEEIEVEGNPPVCYVANIDDVGKLNIRTFPGGDILTTVNNKTKLYVVEDGTEWVYVQFNDGADKVLGYAMKSLLIEA